VAKLPVCSGAEAVRAFERLGYERVSQTGSHVRLKAEGRPSLTVPLYRTLAKGTLRALIRDSGYTVEEFRDAL
jgi:predicted RNA binding protein YcfA (HicA-like mRNA interferase family)